MGPYGSTESNRGAAPGSGPGPGPGYIVAPILSCPWIVAQLFSCLLFFAQKFTCLCCWRPFCFFLNRCANPCSKWIHGARIGPVTRAQIEFCIVKEIVFESLGSYPRKPTKCHEPRSGTLPTTRRVRMTWVLNKLPQIICCVLSLSHADSNEMIRVSYASAHSQSALELLMALIPSSDFRVT